MIKASIKISLPVSTLQNYSMKPNIKWNGCLSPPQYVEIGLALFYMTTKNR